MIKLLIGLLIIACLAPFFIKGPDGEAIMSVDDWKIELPDSLADLFSGAESPSPEPVAAPTEVYRWQDEDGQWHFSNTPPDLETAEIMELDGDINLMEAYVPPVEEKTESTQVAMPSGGVSASPEQMKQMMETVTNLQETIDQRKADMDEIVPGTP